MKKIVALACTVLLAAGMTLTAFAAPSTEGKIITGIEKAVDKDNKEISNIHVVAVKDTDKTTVEDVQKADKLKEALGDKYEEGMAVVEAREIYAEGDVTFPVTLTFTAKGITANHKVVILHYTNGAWEVIEATAGNGTITATFNSFSPIVVVTKGSVSVDDSVKSDKTGDAAMWMVAVVMVAALGTAVVAKKKFA